MTPDNLETLDPSNTFVWESRGEVNNGNGRRLAFIHCDAPRGLYGIAVLKPDYEDIKTGVRILEHSPCGRRFPLVVSKEVGRKLITRLLIDVGMTELPVRFVLGRGEKLETVTKTLEGFDKKG